MTLIEALAERTTAKFDRCPVAHAGQPTAPECRGQPLAETLRPGDVLEMPLHKQVVAQYGLNAEGRRELTLYYADKEISFDDPAMFAFGEALGRQARFVAGEAREWGGGYPWPRVRELLAELLEAGVLRRFDFERGPSGRVVPGARPAPLPEGPAAHARTWHEAEAVFTQLTGRALEVGHLELVVPVFRVAHMVLDAEGRQVGEANVFPPAMRLPVPTRWRACIYGGTRHQAGRPMNVTALKSMRAHWGAMMDLLLRVRAAYLRRYPEARHGWTVGHLERLSTAVLALPTYLLMRAGGRVANGELHPALSSMFRVADGLRMTMHQMLFVPVGEPTLPPHAPMTSEAIYAYAERNFSFFSEHGVCAGPQAMIEEFLSVLVDGRTPREGRPEGLDPALRQAVDAIEPAMDYGLRGLVAYGVVFSAWPMMARAYEQLGRTVATVSHAAPHWHARLQAQGASLRAASYLGEEAMRADREHVYADMVAQCERGLAPPSPTHPLAQRLAPQVTLADQAAATRLHHALHAALGDEPAAVQAAHRTVMTYLRQMRALLAEASRVQAGINAALGRPAPRRELHAADLDLHNQMQGGSTARRVPFLIDELGTALGLAIDVTANHIHIEERQAPAWAG
jgi:hypothetical protein